MTTARTTVKRVPDRGTYDRDIVNAILDEALVCHVGFVHEGTPMVIPTLHARVDDHVILHGSPASRMLRTTRDTEICVTVTLIDGLVLARSAFHHSANYRSVVVLGQPELVTDEAEKIVALDALVDRLVPDRRHTLRPMNRNEIKGTTVIKLAIDEYSAKIRTGGPSDDAEDYALPIWAGVIPVTTTFGDPIPDPKLEMDLAVPEHASLYARPSS